MRANDRPRNPRKNQKMKNQAIKPSQRKAINKIIRFVRSNDSIARITSLRIGINRGFISLAIETDRTDCDKYSLRNVLSRIYFSAHIGAKGAIQINHYSVGTYRAAKHAAYMLHGKVSECAMEDSKL